MANNEIEEFLRRAAERRKQQGRGGGAPAARPMASARPTPPRLNEVIDAEIIEAVPVLNDVSADVARHLDNRAFSNRISQLGGAVRDEIESIQSRVQQDLGQRPAPLPERSTSSNLVQPAAGTAAEVTRHAANVLADELVAIIKNRRTLRQAILLNEIFNRPEHRW